MILNLYIFKKGEQFLFYIFAYFKLGFQYKSLKWDNFPNPVSFCNLIAIFGSYQPVILFQKQAIFFDLKSIL